MSSPALKTTTPSHSLPAQLQQIGLRALPAQLDDFLAHAAKARWSPHQILEHSLRWKSPNARAAVWSGVCVCPALRDSNPWLISNGPGPPKSNGMSSNVLSRWTSFQKAETSSWSAATVWARR